MIMGHHTFYLWISVVVFFLQLLHETKGGHFLSIEDLEEFYDLEEKLVQTFTKYIEEQKQILEVVQQRYEEQKRWQPVINSTDEYLSNPLNVHAMIKRMISDWPLTLALLDGSLAEEEDEEDIKLPTLEEYHGAVHGLARLQLVYNYTISEIVTGSVFPYTDKTSVLTAVDCFAVGKDMYNHKHYNMSIAWFKEALAMTTNQTEAGKDVTTNTGSEQASTNPPLENLYEYLALANCFIGDQRKSKIYFNKLYNNYPEFRPTQNLIQDHLLAINDTCKKLLKNDSLRPKVHDLNITWSEDAKISANYSRLCRGPTLPEASRTLTCFVEGLDHLRPFKMENLHDSPPIYMIHDIITPAERKFIMEKMIDENKMTMDGFVYENWEELPQNSSVSEALVRRLEQLSGYKVNNTASNVRLSSFPVGAEYVVALTVPPKTKEPEFYRYGTTMMFLEEPHSGGLLVFPRLGLSVAPVAGAAIQWYNLNRKYKVNKKMAYGICPIKQGHHTVLTTWFKLGV